MNICIGIVSYLPDDEDIRAIRLEKLNHLLLRCDELFGLPIVIIAQNWKNANIVSLKKSKIILYNYKSKLGITGARKALRSKFINSMFDYLIMLDDDSLLVGDEASAASYISQIEEHPNMYGVFKQLLLKLFAISKEVYKLVDFPDGDPVNSDFFEDMYLIMALNKLHGDKRFTFKRHKLDDKSDSGDHITSTWYKDQDRHAIGDKTRKLIEGL